MIGITKCLQALHLPVDGHGGKWDGLAGFSRWHSDSEEVKGITGGTPVVFEGGYPDFSPWSQRTYTFDCLTGGNGDFTLADRQLAEDIQLADRNAALSYRTCAKLTWHHHQDGKRLLLVPRELHSNVPHIGGANLLRSLDRNIDAFLSEPAQNTRFRVLKKSGLQAPPTINLPLRFTPRLGKRGWDPTNHAALSSWLGKVAQTPHDKPPIAVFDWDHTSIAGECGPVVWHFMLEHLALQVPADKLGELLPMPAQGCKPFPNGFSPDRLRVDISEAYAQLVPLQGDLTAARKLPAYRDFTSKVGAYCEGFDATTLTMHTDGPLWMRWFAGFTPKALGSLAVAAFRSKHDQGLTRRSWISASAGTAGAVRYSFEDGLAARPDIIDLMRGLRSAGVRSCMVTGGVEPMVRALAGVMGYPLSDKDIVGTRYIRDDEGRLTQHLLLTKERPATYGVGKTVNIRNVFESAPILVAGDSDGDYDMLTAFKETQVRLVVHAERQGQIATLYEPQQKPVLQLLQYSDSRSGQFVPTVTSPPKGAVDETPEQSSAA